jgi:predicted nuclease of predicted toxin-antitoxin system
MKFLCDVYISYRVIDFLKGRGFESIHVNSFSKKWETPDSEICRYCDENNFILITKDSDFRDTHLLKKSPAKLIKINLGNTSNNDLLHSLTQYFHHIEKVATASHFMIEIDKDHITITL